MPWRPEPWGALGSGGVHVIVEGVNRFVLVGAVHIL